MALSKQDSADRQFSYLWPSAPERAESSDENYKDISAENGRLAMGIIFFFLSPGLAPID